MDQDKFFDIQNQVRRNQEDVNDFIHGLDNWSNDIKHKDEKLKKQTPSENDDVCIFLWGSLTS